MQGHFDQILMLCSRNMTRDCWACNSMETFILSVEYAFCKKKVQMYKYMHHGHEDIPINCQHLSKYLEKYRNIIRNRRLPIYLVMYR